MGVGRAVETIHRRFQIPGSPNPNRLNRCQQTILENFQFARTELRENEIGGVHQPTIADTDSHPGEPISPKNTSNIAQTFLTAITSTRPNTHPAQGKTQIVANYDKILKRNLVKSDDSGYGLTARVHERRRLHHQNFTEIDFDLRHFGIESIRETKARKSGNETIDGVEADVMTCPIVFRSRISQSDDDFGTGHDSRTPRRSIPLALTSQGRNSDFGLLLRSGNDLRLGRRWFRRFDGTSRTNQVDDDFVRP